MIALFTVFSSTFNICWKGLVYASFFVFLVFVLFFSSFFVAVFALVAGFAEFVFVVFVSFLTGSFFLVSFLATVFCFFSVLATLMVSGSGSFFAVFVRIPKSLLAFLYVCSATSSSVKFFTFAILRIICSKFRESFLVPRFGYGAIYGLSVSTSIRSSGTISIIGSLLTAFLNVMYPAKDT